jgi:hypothetical protein
MTAITHFDWMVRKAAGTLLRTEEQSAGYLIPS